MTRYPRDMLGYGHPTDEVRLIPDAEFFPFHPEA